MRAELATWRYFPSFGRWLEAGFFSFAIALLAQVPVANAETDNCPRAQIVGNGARLCDPPKVTVKRPSGDFRISANYKTYLVEIAHECERVFGTELGAAAYRDSGINILKGDFSILRKEETGLRDIQLNIDRFENVRQTVGIAFGEIDGKPQVRFDAEFAGEDCAVRATLRVKAAEPDQMAADIFAAVLASLISPDAKLTRVIRQRSAL